MDNITCLECGAGVHQPASVGRRRKYCEACRPRNLGHKPVPQIEITCTCGVKFVATPKRIYCSAECQDSARVARNSQPCDGCGTMVRTNSRSTGTHRCRKCRAPKHGEYAMYSKRKCRCEECRATVAAYSRDYVARRAAEGRKLNYADYRKRQPAECVYCSNVFEARVDSTRGLYCSLTCANDAQGRRENPRFRIADSIRLAIYEQDAWVCQLCTIPVDRDAHHLAPTAPTLDHIQPRARGGSDEPNNLRLACRDCNTKRGTDLEWKPARIA